MRNIICYLYMNVNWLKAFLPFTLQIRLESCDWIVLSNFPIFTVIFEQIYAEKKNWNHKKYAPLLVKLFFIFFIFFYYLVQIATKQMFIRICWKEWRKLLWNWSRYIHKTTRTKSIWFQVSTRYVDVSLILQSLKISKIKISMTSHVWRWTNTLM